MMLPDRFKTQMTKLIGNEWTDFEASLNEPILTSVRLNPFKRSHNLSLGKQVPWCPGAYYLEQRPAFNFDPYFHAGHYYVQEASSMFLDHVLRQIDLPKNSKVLDLCSAPGGKATLLASYLGEDGFLHCHEYDNYRANVLRQNITRWGTSNTLITQGPLHNLSRIEIKYDLVLIDAPCSGEGMFRKEARAIDQWSSNKINHCCMLQKNLLELANQLCIPGGYIYYSTCTYNEQENENQIQQFLNQNDYISQALELPFNVRTSTSAINTYRCYPHLIQGEGFSFSLLKKQSEANLKLSKTQSKNIRILNNQLLNPWITNPEQYNLLSHHEINYAIPSTLLAHVVSIINSNNILSCGIPFGVWKGTNFYPEHALSQAIAVTDNIDSTNLSDQEAIQYLKCLSVPARTQTDNTWIKARFEQASLGWIKNTSNGFKNYFPKYLRILSNATKHE